MIETQLKSAIFEETDQCLYFYSIIPSYFSLLRLFLFDLWRFRLSIIRFYYFRFLPLIFNFGLAFVFLCAALANNIFARRASKL